MQPIKVITYLNKDTNEAADLNLADALVKMRECFKYPKSNETIFKDVQHLLSGGLVQSVHHGFAMVGDERMKPDEKFEERYITQKEIYSAYKHEPNLRAVAIRGIDKPGVKIMSGNKVLALIHPPRPTTWARLFDSYLTRLPVAE